MTYTAMRIPLSGDGRRLVVSDLLGSVRVYDVSRVSGVATVKRGDAPPGKGNPPTQADAVSVRESYESAAGLARKTLLAVFDQLIQALEPRAAAGKAGAAQMVERLKAGKVTFGKHGATPWSEQMREGTERYLRAKGDARARVIASFAPSPVPADLRQLIDHQILGRWRLQPAHQPVPGTMTLYSSGKVNSPTGDHSWSFTHGRLTLRWKNARAPGGFWVDTCFVSSDGLSYQGANQLKAKVVGTLIREE